MWAKSKRLCSGVLRKAAILNRMRRSLGTGSAGAVGRGNSLIDAAGLGGQEGFLRPGFAMLRSVAVQNPSPLGLSNYDALDEEDVWVGAETDDGEDADAYLSHPDFGCPQPTPQLVSTEEEEEEEEKAQSEEEKNYDSNPLDRPAKLPNCAGHDMEAVTSPNTEWLASTFKVKKANEALASLGFMGKSLLGRQDTLVEIRREQERQRRLLPLQLPFG